MSENVTPLDKHDWRIRELARQMRGEQRAKVTLEPDRYTGGFYLESEGVRYMHIRGDARPGEADLTLFPLSPGPVSMPITFAIDAPYINELVGMLRQMADMAAREV